MSTNFGKNHQEVHDLSPHISELKKACVPDSFIALANEYIAGVFSGEEDTGAFFHKIVEALDNVDISDLKTCYKTLEEIASSHAGTRIMWLAYIKFMIAFCRVKGWSEAGQECCELPIHLTFLSHVLQYEDSSSCDLTDLDRMSRAEEALQLEYGNFCLSQSIKWRDGAENVSSHYMVEDILFRMPKLIELSKGKEAFLSIYSAILTGKINKYSAADMVKKSDQLSRGNQSFKNNSIIHLAQIIIDSFLAPRPDDLYGDESVIPADVAKPGYSLSNMETKSDRPGVLTHLLANILLTEDLPNLYFCFDTILECLKRETEPDQKVREFAEMFEFLSINASAESLKSLFSLTANLSYRFPDNESVITAYGWVQYHRTKHLRPSQKIPARIDFIQLISDHPHNEELRKIFTSGDWNIRLKPGIGELIERKYEIDTLLSQFLEFDKGLIDLYANLLYDIASLQKTSDSVKTVGVLEYFLEKHYKDADIH